MHLSYVYPTPIPSQLAAPIQILNTCWHLCERGVSTTVYAGTLTVADVETALAYYGLTPHPRLRIVFGITDPGAVAQQIHRESATIAAPYFVMSRGEPGVALFRYFRHRLYATRMRRPASHRYLYEAHRLCYTEAGRWQNERQAMVLLPGLAQAQQAWRRWRMYRQEGATVTGVDGLVVLTPGVEQALWEAFSVTAPTLLLPSGTATAPIHVPPVAERDLDILYVGKLRARKGIYDLIAAMRYLPDRQLWLVGGTEDDHAQVRAAAAAHGVDNQICLPGFVEPSQIREWYQRARVGLCPLPSGQSQIAEAYTSPLKVLEMMACGTPIVGTDVPALRTLLTDDETALLVEPNAPEALARAIATLLADSKRAQQLADGARNAVDFYTWPKRAARLHEFLSTLIEGN